MTAQQEAPPEANWFGETPVDPSEKTGMVRAVFDRVASRYDLMNDLMSGGVHRLWKADLMRQVSPRAHEHLIDVAGGTGDIATAWRRAGGGDAVLCDINHAMLSEGRDRALDRGVLNGMAWAVGNAKVEPKGNAITITKQASGTAKIDPLMAAFNAVALMAMNPQATGQSYLRSSEMLVI